MTDGHNCYPICTDCTESGKDVMKQGKQDKIQARKEKQAKVKVAREKPKRPGNWIVVVVQQLMRHKRQ